MIFTENKMGVFSNENGLICAIELIDTQKRGEPMRQWSIGISTAAVTMLMQIKLKQSSASMIWMF